MSTPMRELAQLLEEKETLRALECGPEARVAWLLNKRKQVVGLLAEIDAEIEKSTG